MHAAHQGSAVDVGGAGVGYDAAISQLCANALQAPAHWPVYVAVDLNSQRLGSRA